ncbi:MAG: phage holin family protein [Candidatus Moraniibacteriota bacterium]
MIPLAIRLVVSALAFLVVAEIIPGITVAGFATALVLAILWGLINITIKPIVIILTLPINLLTFGIFTFIINGFFFWLLGGIVKGFEVHGFWTAVLGALVLSAILTIFHWLLGRSRLN